MSSFWRQIGVTHLDHVAVVTADFQRTLDDYLHLPNSLLLRGPGINNSQKTHYAFVRLEGGTVIEILSPHGKESPIANIALKRQGVYHFCFAVQSIERAVDVAEKAGAKVIIEPVCDDAFHGARIAFLAHPNHGLFELVEISAEKDTAIEAPNEQQRGERIHKSHPIPDDTRQRLSSVMLKAFPALRPEDVEQAAMNQLEQWDSLGHIQLIMAVEQEFSVSFSADELFEAEDFYGILSLVEKYRGDPRSKKSSVIPPT